MKKFNKFTAFLLLFIMCVMTSVSAGDIKVQLDGTDVKFDVAPRIINNRTMVPLRAISEAIGATVLWNGDDRSILLNRGDMVAMLQIDNEKLFKNDETISLDSPPVIVSDRTLVPVRAICETFGFDVEWNADERIVVLTSN